MRLDVLRALGAICAAGAVLAGARAASADVPLTLTHQGRLYDSEGAPITGSLQINYAIYDEENSATSVWSESFEIAVDDGYYSASLGNITSLPLSPTTS